MTEHDSKSSSSADSSAASADAQPAAIGAVNAALSARGGGMQHGDASVHDNSTSHAAADALGAKAFTTGQDVFFGAGAYDPGSAEGQATLRHELHHTVQQSSGPVEGREWSPGLVVSDPHDHDEREATEVAHNHGSHL
jgi:Domain of unknown function (DUF4157)